MSALDFKDLLVGLTYVERNDGQDSGEGDGSTELILESPTNPHCLLVKIYVPSEFADEYVASIPHGAQ